MAARMEPTRYTGVFKRGSRYCVVWRAGGKQHKKSAGTLEAARKLRAAMQADVARDEFDPTTALTFREYAEAWVERYTGTGRRGFREGTRDDYRRLLGRFAFPWFDGQVAYPGAPSRALRLSEVRPADIARFVGWLADPEAQAAHARELARQEHRRLRAEGKATRHPDRRERALRETLARLARKPRDEWSESDHERQRRSAGELERLQARLLSDSTIRNAINPLRSCFKAAKREGLIRHNPTSEVALPHHERVEDEDGEDVRALSREQLAAFLRVVHPRHALMFTLLAATGLRVSELIALQWRHLRLDGSEPAVRVRRAIVRGRVEPPKSRYGRRDVPIGTELVSALRQHRKITEWPGDEDLVFPSLRGTPLDPGNLLGRVLRPAAEETEAAWAGFHSFRHTCASLLFSRGRNVVAVQRWLGHHSASFTLKTYIHLLPEDAAAPLDLAAELGQGGNRVASRPASAGLNGDVPDGPDSASAPDRPSPDETGRDAETAF